jgi:cytochrome c oxidase subunit 2
MEQLILFHTHTIRLILLITGVVGVNIIQLIINKNIILDIKESHTLELFWTISPTIILLLIGLPSIRILYMIDEVYKPALTLKTVGQQWFWSYEYSDFSNIEINSYIRTDSVSWRLIEADTRLVLPNNTQIRNLITALDVLHSWAIPSLGVRIDAVPGRLNQVSFLSLSNGLYLGQCSEICGANHRFMPISLEITNQDNFISWVKKK